MAPSKSAESVVTVAEPWVFVALRANLFSQISDQSPIKLLQNAANKLWGSRGPASTPLERAELELYMKIKSKADHAQLQKEVEKIEELERKEEQETQRKQTQKAGRVDLDSGDDDDEPSRKRAKPNRSHATLDLRTRNDDVPAPSLPKRRVSSKPEDEPTRPRQTPQMRPLFEASDAELPREFTTRSNEKDRHNRRRVSSSDYGFSPPPQVANQRSALSGRGGKMPRDDMEEDDDIGYSDDELDPVLPDHKSQAELRRKVIDDEKKLGLPPLGSSSSTTGYTTKKISASENSIQPNSRGNTFNSRNRDEDADADDEDDELPRNPGASLGRMPSALNQRTPGASMKLSSRDSRDSAATHSSRMQMPPPAVPQPAATRASNTVPRVANRSDPRESDGITYRRAVATVAEREYREEPRDAVPSLPPVRAPAGRPSQDYTAPDYDAEYITPNQGPPNPGTPTKEIEYVFKNGRRYRLVKYVRRILQADGTYVDGDREEDDLCLSDAPKGCDSPPDSWRNIKLSGRNGEIWDRRWDPQPDPEPKGGALWSVPAGQALTKRPLPALELLRKSGMEVGEGSEYVHGERRVMVPKSKGKKDAPGSYQAAERALGQGQSVAGSVMPPPPSTIATSGMRYSVREGKKVFREDQKHERGVNRTTPVDSLGVDRDRGIARTIFQRMGKNPDGSDIKNDDPPIVYAPPGGLTSSNVARLNKQTKQPRDWHEVVHGKQRPGVPESDGRATPRDARAESLQTESIYAASVTNRDEAGNVVSQTFRTREDIDARERAAYAAEPERVRHDDQFKPAGGDEDLDENVAAVTRQLSNQELEAEEERRNRELDREMREFDRAMNGASSTVNPRANTFRPSSNRYASSDIGSAQGALRPAHHHPRGNGGEGGGGYRGGRGGGSQYDGGSQYGGGSQRGGRGRGGYRGGRGRGGKGPQTKEDAEAEFYAMMNDSRAEFGYEA